MTTSTMTQAGPAVRAGRGRRGWGDRVLYAYTWLIIAWLCLPIAVMIAFGFNNAKGRLNLTWQGFTFKWYGRLFAVPDLTTALVNSLTIAVLAALGATVLGTLIGLALGRFRFRGQGALNLVQFAAISAPETVMGASLLSFFVQLGVGRGYLTILVSHIMFSLSFVAVTVRARVLTLDPFVEEAAQDLGASGWTTFRLVTLPMIFPAVLAGGLLAFALSIDDFIITSFNSGSTLTFPLWIWGAQKNGLPPQVNVMGTLIFLAGVLLAVGNAVLARRRR
ncbi:ABC transporter permease [Actinoallomurus rhizosphaericola]|uniref:ABC transporter permease n=1 Tax=Actinoallomurus rhizosphaericola TaxID=2952536 RepID=UPI002093D473|nr:ABC transporter permease [Actinoallomurus rhizosphaericola]MCO5996944.1 ABC transporter permease [Actinoallomurus rhizosphaericola]